MKAKGKAKGKRKGKEKTTASLPAADLLLEKKSLWLMRLLQVQEVRFDWFR